MSELLVRISGLYKIFGDDPDNIMPLVEAGRSKEEILAETGHTLGLKDINLDIEKGHIFVIMGLSGCGKSTLIRHFNRLIDPTRGRIEVDGVDVMKLSPESLLEFRRHRMSMVFQRFGLMPHRTVLENVAYGLAVQGVDAKVRRATARKWLETVGLSGYEEQYPNQLSGGQQQRVGLARALCTDADILLMDEAFSALDPLIRSEMQEQLIELQKRLQKTIIFITHDLDEALRLGDRIAILKDGALVQVGAPQEILLNPADDYVKAFVRDVNRARALTVKTVMQPPSCEITSPTLGGALGQMRERAQDYGFYLRDRRYQGVLVRQALEVAVEGEADTEVSDRLLDPVVGIAPESLLEEVLPETLDTPYPLPVVDKSGRLRGQLSRTSLARALGQPDEASGG